MFVLKIFRIFLFSLGWLCHAHVVRQALRSESGRLRALASSPLIFLPEKGKLLFLRFRLLALSNIIVIFTTTSAPALKRISHYTVIFPFRARANVKKISLALSIFWNKILWQFFRFTMKRARYCIMCHYPITFKIHVQITRLRGVVHCID